MKLSDFDYSLPKELIAQYPLKKRDAAKLLVLNRQEQTIEHREFKDIAGYLNKDDLIVLNNTKVLRCRLYGKRPTGGKVEILLLSRKSDSVFNCLISPGRVKSGEKIIFTPAPIAKKRLLGREQLVRGFNGGNIFGIVNSKNEIRFNAKDANTIYNLGTMPLPPYIKRDPQDLDNTYYQTVYASQEGAVASPTAGLHFTKELMEKIKSGGANFAYITLHVGIGTFRPVKTDDISQHKMESEYFKIAQDSIKAIENTRKQKSRIISVGTTVLRTLEAFAKGQTEGYTDLFIYPGYKFSIADCLLTNFHLPKTTLFMLVCAFCAEGASASGGAGIGLIKKAYQEAIDKKYRFYSYGDAMLIV